MRIRAGSQASPPPARDFFPRPFSAGRIPQRQADRRVMDALPFQQYHESKHGAAWGTGEKILRNVNNATRQINLLQGTGC